MGGTVSSLVFRPPSPTPIPPSEYFYLDVDVHTPLCTNRQDGGCGPPCVGSATSCFSGESDLASLDSSFLSGDDGGDADTVGGHRGPRRGRRVNNVRKGQVYKVPAFFIRRRNATRTLLFSHGNAEDLGEQQERMGISEAPLGACILTLLSLSLSSGMMYARMKDLAMVLGVNVMAYDYTGYGLSVPGPLHTSSSGKPEGPSENMVYRNIEAAFRYLTTVRNVAPSDIVLYGRSLGSGPSCYLAAKTALNGRPVGALILHSPFLSVYRVVADLNGLDMGMVGDMFNNERRAASVRCPTLVIHGMNDEVVPFFHGQRLLAAVPEEYRACPFWVENMGHNHIESRCRRRYIAVVSHFLQMSAPPPVPPPYPSEADAHYRQRTAGGYGAGDPRQPPAFGPQPVPPGSRALPTEVVEGSSFYVNRTWLRHAKFLLREAFADAGCNVDTTSVASGASSAAASNGASSAAAWQRRGGSGTDSRNDMSTGRHQPSASWEGRDDTNASDARDGSDEFAPWRRPQSTPRQAKPKGAPAAVVGAGGAAAPSRHDAAPGPGKGNAMSLDVTSSQQRADGGSGGENARQSIMQRVYGPSEKSRNVQLEAHRARRY